MLDEQEIFTENVTELLKFFVAREVGPTMATAVFCAALIQADRTDNLPLERKDEITTMLTMVLVQLNP